MPNVASDAATRERVLQETVSLANRLLVADGADPGELLHHRAALIRASGYLTIAFQARGAEEPAPLAALLEKHSVTELFREGWSRAVSLQTEARQLVADGWGIAHPDPVAALDAPLDAQIGALLEKRPLYVELQQEVEGSGRRDFLTLAEIDEVQISVRMAAAVGVIRR